MADVEIQQKQYLIKANIHKNKPVIAKGKECKSYRILSRKRRRQTKKNNNDITLFWL